MPPGMRVPIEILADIINHIDVRGYPLQLLDLRLVSRKSFML